MNTASLELCKTLHELSGWDDTYHYYDADDVVDEKAHAMFMSRDKNCPAYDAGYLLRKLPKYIDKKHWLYLQPISYIVWAAGYKDTENAKFDPDAWANTPEDALCKLAIELFKQGVLKGEV